MVPFLGLVCKFGVLAECSGTLLNFSPCFTFHLYLLHNRTSYLLSFTFTRRMIWRCLGTFIAVNLALTLPFLNVVSHTTTHFLFSLSLSCTYLIHSDNFTITIIYTQSNKLNFRVGMLPIISGDHSSQGTPEAPVHTQHLRISLRQTVSGIWRLRRRIRLLKHTWTTAHYRIVLYCIIIPNVSKFSVKPAAHVRET
jgi:hypothetical protein